MGRFIGVASTFTSPSTTVTSTGLRLKSLETFSCTGVSSMAAVSVICRGSLRPETFLGEAGMPTVSPYPALL